MQATGRKTTPLASWLSKTFHVPVFPFFTLAEKSKRPRFLQKQEGGPPIINKNAKLVKKRQWPSCNSRTHRKFPYVTLLCRKRRIFTNVQALLSDSSPKIWRRHFVTLIFPIMLILDIFYIFWLAAQLVLTGLVVGIKIWQTNVSITLAR